MLPLQFRLKTSLETRSKNRTGLTSAVNKTLDFFASCLDEDGLREEMGAAPLLEVLDVIGGWRIMDETIEEGNSSRYNTSTIVDAET